MKFSCGWIQKRKSGIILFKGQGPNIPIGFFTQCLVANESSGCYNFNHFPLHDSLGQFWVFYLFANGNTISRFYQFWEIIIQGMIWESRQSNAGSFSIGPFGQDNSKDLGCNFRIFQKCFVEVTHPEKNQRIFILGFHFQKLLHYRCLCHHIFTHSMHLLLSAYFLAER